MSGEPGGGGSPPDFIEDLRLFEGPNEPEMGRIVYQGRERPRFAPERGRRIAHEYWFIESDGRRGWKVVQAVATFDRQPRGEPTQYRRHVEELVGRAPDNRQALDVVRANADRAVGSTVSDVFADESIRFVPPFSKDAADYRDRDDPAFDATHDRCKGCVHYIPGGGCHFVRGEIDPEDYCEEYYADYGVFAHDHGEHVEVNAELVGPNFHPGEADIADFVGEIRERLQQRQREQEGSRVEGY